MLIRRLRALVGEQLLPSGPLDLLVEGGKFVKVGDVKGDGLDGRGLLAVPGLINCHTHVGDSIAKDVAAGLDVDSATHPALGVKAAVLSNTEPSHLAEHMRATVSAMVRGGTTTFVDFREGGPVGARLLSELDVPARAIVLGRASHDACDPPEGDASQADLDEVLRCADGIGISGANECGDAALARYARSGKLRAIHAAETASSVRRSAQMTGRSEVERALSMNPHFLVHMTHATAAQMSVAAQSVRGVVACPRANAALGAGTPDIKAMIRAGCNVALGTDNVMVNSPDMLREIDYTTKSSGIRAVDALRAATVNAGRILGDGSGVIAEGRRADAFFVDLNDVALHPAHDLHAAIAGRASEASVRAVMVRGRIVHGSL